jgi:hypothetical protein
MWVDAGDKIVHESDNISAPVELFLAVLGFELKALWLLSRHSTTSAICPDLPQ